MISIDNIIFNRKDLTPDERVLYAYLLDRRQVAKHCNMIEDGFYYYYHTNEELTELLGCSKSKLIKIKKSLEEKGILVQKRELGGKTKYFTFNKVGEV